MLKIQQFDIKSGKDLTEYDPESKTEKPRIKALEHSYLEHWLDKHGLRDTAQFAVANFYEGVTDRDRQRQEEQNRILVFTNGKKGYFADRDTANLIVNGDVDRDIEPIYAATFDPTQPIQVYFEPRIVEVPQDRPDGKGKTTIQQERMDVKLIAEDGSLKPLGTIHDRDIRLPKGTTAIGHLELRDDSKRAFEFAGKRIVVDNVDRYDARHRIFDETPIHLTFDAHPDNGLKDQEPLVIVSFTENTTAQILGTLKQKTA
jgi:hypothetical protein